MSDPTIPDTLTAAAELQTIANALIGESVISDRPGQMTRLEVMASDVRKIAARLSAPAPTVDRHAQWGREAFRLAARSGWSAFGSHVDQSVTLEFDGEGEDGLPIWERPVPPVLDHPEADHAG